MEDAIPQAEIDAAYAAEQAYQAKRISDLFKATRGRINCCLCGKFVGRNGHLPPDDPEGWEPVCRACLERQVAARPGSGVGLATSSPFADAGVSPTERGTERF